MRYLQLFSLTLIVCMLSCPSNAEIPLTQLVEKTQSSVVTIITFDENQKPISQGTGFFIKKDGQLITNRHVIEEASNAGVMTFEGKVYKVERIIALDDAFDLVNLKIDLNGDTIQWLEIESNVPKTGEKIFVIGSPKGLEQTVSEGIVSSIRFDENKEVFAYQITAAISPGSRGSPVMNFQGEVIGVATFNIKEGQNLNFAMPSKKIISMPFLKGLLHVNTVPNHATVKIVNIKPAFYQGIELESGKYSLEVAAEGYETKYLSIFLDIGEEKIVDVELAKKVVPENEVSVETKQGQELEIQKAELEKLKLEIEIKKKELEKISQEVVSQKPDVEVEKAEKSNSNPITVETRPSTEEIKPKNEFKIVSTHNKEAKKWIIKSQKALQEKNWVEAIRTATTAISLDPGLSAAYVNRAWAYCEKNFFEDAIRDCDTAISINSKEVSAYVNRALAYIKINKLDEAMKDCTQALKLDSENAVAHNNIGTILQKQGNVKDSEKYYYKSCDLGFEIACENYKEITGYYPDEIELRVDDLIRKSQKAFSEGEWGTVIKFINDVIEIDSDNYLAFTILGGAYANKKSYGEAITNCTKAIRINPDFGLAYNNLGYTYETFGQNNEALLNYEIGCNLKESTSCNNLQRLKSNIKSK
jgi:tetratricopeptide (TPR) repeat protein